MENQFKKNKMKKFYPLIIVILFIIVGCSTEHEKIVNKVKDQVSGIEDKRERKKQFDKILETEIDLLVKKNNLVLARKLANSINSDYDRKANIDDILEAEVEVLLNNKKYEEAKKIAEQINSDYDRNDNIDEILITQYNSLFKEKKYVEAKNIANQINGYQKSSLLRKINKKLQ